MFAEIKFTKSHPDAKAPLRATKGAAAVDLTSCEVNYENGTFIVNTGLRTSFPEGFVLLVFGRSGFARKHGVHLANGVGVIDSDYRGDLQLMFRCEDPTMSTEDMFNLLAPGQRVAQAILMPLPVTDWVEVCELPDSERGTGGFGSTGT